MLQSLHTPNHPLSSHPSIYLSSYLSTKPSIPLPTYPSKHLGTSGDRRDLSIQVTNVVEVGHGEVDEVV